MSNTIRRCLLRRSSLLHPRQEQKRSLALPADDLARFRHLASLTSSEQKPRVLITGSLGQLGRGLATMYSAVPLNGSVNSMSAIADAVKWANTSKHCMTAYQDLKKLSAERFQLAHLIAAALDGIAFTSRRFMYGEDSVVMTDVRQVPRNASDVYNYRYADILDVNSLEKVVVEEGVNTLIHFSALLSAVGEQNVPLAIRVNCEGVQNVLEIARKHNVKLFIPSTIGAFGPSTPRIRTPDITAQRPRTIYGVSKVYAELLGEYYHERFGVDFRCLRFPGIISATKPGGGTTDYAIQIFFDALQTGHHTCYLRPDTRLPMMYDTDCTASVLFMLAADSSNLSQRTYNVTGFSFTPEEIATAIRRHLPDFVMDYQICPLRQKIADSWPQSLDDSTARRDWGWRNDFGLEETVEIMILLLERQLTRGDAKTALSA